MMNDTASSKLNIMWHCFNQRPYLHRVSSIMHESATIGIAKLRTNVNMHHKVMKITIIYCYLSLLFTYTRSCHGGIIVWLRTLALYDDPITGMINRPAGSEIEANDGRWLATAGFIWFFVRQASFSLLLTHTALWAAVYDRIPRNDTEVIHACAKWSVWLNGEGEAR